MLPARTYLALFIIGLVIAGIILFFPKNTDRQPQSSSNETSLFEGGVLKFTSPKKSAHYESNTPAHEAILAAPPLNVVVDFNFDLSAKSTLEITFEGKNYATAPASVDENKLALRAPMDPNASDGLYTVSYNACWPDNTCHDGSFQFGIDRRVSRDFADERGKKNVTIKLTNTQFAPSSVRVSAGTTVTWVNDDAVEHYVNTDSHPAHTFFPAQNSKLLKKADTFSLTFDSVGAYPYHCSAHEATMRAMIVVEE